MNTLLFLIFFPMVVAVLMLIIPESSYWRKLVISIAGGALIVASIMLTGQFLLSGSTYFAVGSHALNQIILAIEIILAVMIIAISIKYRQFLAVLLMATGACMTGWFELTHSSNVHVEYNLFVDNLSLIMILIIGIIGSLIAFYSIGYMRDYHHHHPEIKDRSHFFFFIVFAFLGAMNGLVFSNNLMWLFFFWEITTFCSFFLIGYSQEKVAINNAFNALKMNLLGGIGFSAAIIVLFSKAGTIELSALVHLPAAKILLPVALLAFAGITKSAQMPFSSWLLGAMVAPTPVSALLHSSTMVKAGVYLIIRLAPVFALVEGTQLVGTLVALVGATTFLLASIIAITQKDAKRILAYSTIANLGLIILCAGIGSYQMMWAAIMLVVFHAIAKSLLFLSVGTVEHNIGNRIVESMDGLITLMPKVAIGMVIGMAGMFLAPFGMLISKWAVLEGIVTANPIFTIFIAFGSAATLFFWTKWLGKIIMVKSVPVGIKPEVPFSETMTLSILSVLTIVTCLTFPMLSKYSLEPFIYMQYAQNYLLDQSNVVILLFMMAVMVVLPLRLLVGNKYNYRPQYLSGTNLETQEQFQGSLGEMTFSLKSFYLSQYFDENRLFVLGVAVSILLILIMIGVSL